MENSAFEKPFGYVCCLLECEQHWSHHVKGHVKLHQMLCRLLSEVTVALERCTFRRKMGFFLTSYELALTMWLPLPFYYSVEGSTRVKLSHQQNPQASPECSKFHLQKLRKRKTYRDAFSFQYPSERNWEEFQKNGLFPKTVCWYL